MNILMAVFFSVALQDGLPCIDASGNSTGLRDTAAQLQPPERYRTGVFGTRSTEGLGPDLPATSGNREELQFYVSSHAQVVSELSETFWTPWLGLRAFAVQRRNSAPQESDVAHHPGLGGVNGSCNVIATLENGLARTLEWRHEQNITSSGDPERLTVVNNW